MDTSTFQTEEQAERAREFDWEVESDQRRRQARRIAQLEQRVDQLTAKTAAAEAWYTDTLPHLDELITELETGLPAAAIPDAEIMPLPCSPAEGVSLLKNLTRRLQDHLHPPIIDVNEIPF